MMVGLYHFANPGLDVVKMEVADVLSPRKQQEILAVVEKLARFRPTKIAVETLPANEARWNERYEQFRRGTRELERDEREQLGFRLAARFGHARLYAVDHEREFPLDPVLAYAREKDAAYIRWFERSIQEITADLNRMQRELSVGEGLRTLNDPDRLVRDHGWYVNALRVGAGDTFVGADLVAGWYERNIRIFANVLRIAQPGERVLLLIGAGDLPILRELALSAPGIRLVEARDYL